jgi:hypothetical protein
MQASMYSALRSVAGLMSSDDKTLQVLAVEVVAFGAVVGFLGAASQKNERQD